MAMQQENQPAPPSLLKRAANAIGVLLTASLAVGAIVFGVTTLHSIAADQTAPKANPDHKVRMLVQRLKFTGHFLETMHKLAAIGVYEPDEGQQRMLQGTAQQIALVVEALAQERAYEKLPEIRKKDFQLYLDLVGDSAHALHALELALRILMS